MKTYFLSFVEEFWPDIDPKYVDANEKLVKEMKDGSK